MKRWLLAAAVLAGAWLSLPARGKDEKPAALPADLALVPAGAKAFMSVRAADAWDSALAKDFRKAMGKDGDAFEKHLKDMLGTGAAGIERITGVMTDFERDAALVAIQFKEKIDAKLASKLIAGGSEEEVGEQKVWVSGERAAFVKGDRTLAVGMKAAILAALKNEGRRSESLAKALARAAGKHTAVAWGDPSGVPIPDRALAGPAIAFKPFLASKGAMAWADVGTEVKLGFSVGFAGEKDAEKAAKVAEAARHVAIAGLALAADELAKMSKVLAEAAEAGEKALAKATLKRDGATLAGGMELKLDKAATAKMVVEAVAKVRQAAMRMQAQNNLKQIGLALHNYHDTHGAFPPQAIYDKDGKALLSWRVLILPYIEQDNLYRKFRLDEAWDSPHNKKLLAVMPRVYAPVMAKASTPQGTFYQVFHGKGAMWEGKRGVRLTDVTDGTSNTIAVVEAGKDVPWSKPDDIPFDGAKDLPKLGAEHPTGFNAVFGDGSVRFISKTIKMETLKALITRNGGEVTGDIP